METGESATMICPAVGGIVLCGGRSSRMGRSKAWLPFGNEFLLQRIVRILRAIEMMASGNESVTTIAMHVGYSSLSAFHAAFRDLTDQTPSEYRRGFEPGERRPHPHTGGRNATSALLWFGSGGFGRGSWRS